MLQAYLYIFKSKTLTHAKVNILCYEPLKCFVDSESPYNYQWEDAWNAEETAEEAARIYTRPRNQLNSYPNHQPCLCYSKNSQKTRTSLTYHLPR